MYPVRDAQGDLDRAFPAAATAMSSVAYMSRLARIRFRPARVRPADDWRPAFPPSRSPP